MGRRRFHQDDITALENRIEALKTARIDALPLKERAARVEQQRRSYARIEKQQIERITALEEQLAAEKLHLQETKLNIQQAQAEADRIALQLAAQMAADGQWGDSDDFLAGENMDEEQETPDAEPTLEKFRELLHEMMTRIPPEQAANAFRTVSRRISRKTSTQDLLNSGPPDKQRRVGEPATTQTTERPVPLALAELCNPPEPMRACSVPGLQALRDSLLSFYMTLQPLHDFLLLVLHPFSRCAIGLFCDLQVHQLKRILVFTDGSHDQQNSETDINTGGSMVVLAQSLDGHISPFGGTNTSYHQDASLLPSNGSISSGGAEALAIAWALTRVITPSPLHIPVEIHTDCMFGLASTLRGHSCPTHAILLDTCASLFQTLRMTRRVSCHHVKGHSGPRLLADIATNSVPLSRAPCCSPTDRTAEMGVPVICSRVCCCLLPYH